MINFQLLGRVTAWRGDWVADLTVQQQLLLAKLVLYGGRPVSRTELCQAIWYGQDHYGPEALKRVVSELRAALRPGWPDPGDDPIPVSDGAYRLRMDRDQADVLRFKALLTRAKATGDLAAARDALAVWGRDAAGLHGGHPLLGLENGWARGLRDELRKDYRHVRLLCLEHDQSEGRYLDVSQECRALVDGPEALRDERFMTLWMKATYLSGHRSEALEVYERATEAARLRPALPPATGLRVLADRIRHEDPTLGTPTTTPRATTKGRRMSDDQPVFNNSGTYSIGLQAGRVEGGVSFSMPPVPAPAAAADVVEDDPNAGETT